MFSKTCPRIALNLSVNFNGPINLCVFPEITSRLVEIEPNDGDILNTAQEVVVALGLIDVGSDRSEGARGRNEQTGIFQCSFAGLHRFSNGERNKREETE